MLLNNTSLPIKLRIYSGYWNLFCCVSYSYVMVSLSIVRSNLITPSFTLIVYFSSIRLYILMSVNLVKFYTCLYNGEL
jgi:hypothetical protein